MSTIPPLERTIDLADMIAYAGATWDWHRLHYDPAYLADRRLDAPVVDGQMFGALLAAQLQSWLGPDWALVKLHFRFRSLVFAGEKIRCVGEVVSAADDELEVELRIEADGRTAVAPAGAVLRRRR